jgi:tetratricopeptide (TPR) repeat protein
MKFIPLIVFIIFAGLEVKAQTPVLVNDSEFQVAARAAIDSLYNQNPGAVSDLMKPWSDSYPEHPVWYLWEAMEMWWKVLIDLHDDSHDDLLFEKMEKANEAADRLLKESPGHADAHIVKAVANGYIARQNANRERWLRSVRTARTAYQAHIELEKSAPDLSDNLFAKGLKKYYSAYLPEAYTIVRAVSWLLPDGDKAEGLELLELTSRDAIFARPEATYFLGLILLNYEEDYERAMNQFYTLVEAYPNNSYYRRLLVRALFQQRMYDAALTEIKRAMDHWQFKGYDDQPVLREEMLYWKGRILNQYGRIDEAYDAFYSGFNLGLNLPNRQMRSFHALNGYYAGLLAERRGELVTARSLYRAVSQLECEADIRKRASERMSEL